MIVPAQLKALIVDDNAYARAATAASLRKLGLVHISESEGGAGAIGMLLEAPFDVMFMDWYMPEISGSGLLQVVRDKRFGAASRLPIVLITAYPSREVIAKARELGVSEILTKPFTVNHVSIALARVLPDLWDVPEDEPLATGTDKTGP